MEYLAGRNDVVIMIHEVLWQRHRVWQGLPPRTCITVDTGIRWPDAGEDGGAAWITDCGRAVGLREYNTAFSQAVHVGSLNSLVAAQEAHTVVKVFNADKQNVRFLTGIPGRIAPRGLGEEGQPGYE